jgi:hypothetical protein
VGQAEQAKGGQTAGHQRHVHGAGSEAHPAAVPPEDQQVGRPRVDQRHEVQGDSYSLQRWVPTREELDDEQTEEQVEADAGYDAFPAPIGVEE